MLILFKILRNKARSILLQKALSKKQIFSISIQVTKKCLETSADSAVKIEVGNVLFSSITF
jgi:hypothetical protein